MLSVMSLWSEQKHDPKPASKFAPASLWAHTTADLKQLNAQINNNWGIHFLTNTNRFDNMPKRVTVACKDMYRSKMFKSTQPTRQMEYSTV